MTQAVDPAPKTPTHVQVSLPLLNDVVAYLATRPYQDVSGILGRLAVEVREQAPKPEA